MLEMEGNNACLVDVCPIRGCASRSSNMYSIRFRWSLEVAGNGVPGQLVDYHTRVARIEALNSRGTCDF